ncbi:MAG TPA: MBL fold metallo-hydrolase [Candidatus Omnitrophota bacterium]|nr:MBL fold metallo-hydrolase [Candidatus Omnitrophota bacterium]HPN88993.1 MBL fold metallo-hydrolase [Candidatus Omnitrophota bacterium]
MNIPQELFLKQIENGPMANFTYFIGDAGTQEVGIVDPGWDSKELIKIAEKEHVKIVAVLLTHGHFDHANEADSLALEFNIPIYVSLYEPISLKSKNLIKVDNYQKINIGSIEIDCLLTPGHTPGSQCFKYKNVLLTGDTLFLGCCGRCDLPGGNPKDMYHSLYNIIMKLPDATLLFPGHAYSEASYATLFEQKRTNPYLMCKNEQEFLEEFMG